MITAPEQIRETSADPFLGKPVEVMLADGNWLPLNGLTRSQLSELQWDQEQHFARAIAALPKNSHERALVTGQAYDTVCTIFAAQQTDDQPFVMGLDKRYMRLVLELLNTQIIRGIGRPRLFEVGYGSGTLLKEISDHGFPVAGVEISSTMRDHAIQLLGERHADQLLF